MSDVEPLAAERDFLRPPVRMWIKPGCPRAEAQRQRAEAAQRQVAELQARLGG